MVYTHALWRRRWLRGRGARPRFVPLDRKQLRNLPHDVSGWWLLGAELLAVAILLVLTAVAGSQTRALFAAIDRTALADLARSDPGAVCINSTAAGWRQEEGRLQLEPEYVWPNGSAADCYNFDEGSPGSLFALNGSTRVLDHTTLAAMRLCGILTGFANTTEVADHIDAGTAEELPSFAGASHATTGDSIRYYTTYDLRPNATVRADVVSDGFGAKPSPAPGAAVKGSFAGAAVLLPANWSSIPGDYCVGISALESTRVCWDARTSQFIGSGLVHSGVPPNITSFGAPWSDNQPEPFVVRVDEGIGTHVWLQVARQDASTAACLARHATHAAKVLWRRAPCADGENPSELNLTLARLLVRPRLDAFSRDYKCPSGIDMAAPDAADAITLLTALRASAKVQLRVTLFVSMTDTNYDDLYAVYTGILGALFGAIALLVTTLFVYALTALKRTLVCVAPVQVSPLVYSVNGEP